MTRPTSRFTPRFLLSLGLSAAVFLAGCEDSTPTAKESVPYDAAKSKSQEDSMKKAAQEAKAASKK